MTFVTIEEKRQRIKANCINCDFCPLYNAIPYWANCHKGDADIERNYEIMFGKGESNDQSETDIENRQAHFDG